jgi:very-short-patch-repair endonuclease
MARKDAPMGRVIILLICLILGGFVFPYLILIAAVLAVFIFKDFTSPQIDIGPPTPPRRLTVTSADANWKDEFLAFCESPAETAFLEAAVAEYRLSPESGKLRGGGLVLELQVKEAPYRVDFLVDGWLVVEIDGAAYHSSPEAIANDTARDEVLRSRGYSVLRIPAKIVFASGTEAIGRVSTALAERPKKSARSSGRITLQSPTTIRALSPIPSLRQVLSTVNTFVENANTRLTIAAAQERALAPAVASLDAEQQIVELAIKSAERRIEIDEFCKDPEKARLYQETYNEFSKAFDDGEHRPSFVVPPLIPPVSDGDGDEEINRVVQLVYQGMLEKRAQFLDETRTRLSSNPGLPDRVKKYLHEWDCGAVWDYIAPITANPFVADSATLKKARWVTFTHAPADQGHLP